jgi:competence protein ComEA
MSEISVPPRWLERLEGLGATRRETILVAGLVALVVFGGLGVWSRGAPASIAPPARASEAVPEPSATSASVVVVHVAGAVHRPGIYELSSGARVADAIELAGGPLPRADMTSLNLAAVVSDGSQILVLRSGTAVAGPVASPSASQAALVNLNLADQVALESIPGLGPVKAAAILQLRAEIGSFDSIDQLLDVTGIGPATLESLRPYVTL